MYPRVRKYLTISDKEIEVRLVQLELIAEPVEGHLRIRAAVDPEDDRYLVAALEGRAGFIVSGDKHLLALKEYEGVRIVTPRVFLNILKG